MWISYRVMNLARKLGLVYCGMLGSTKKTMKVMLLQTQTCMSSYFSKIKNTIKQDISRTLESRSFKS